MFELRSYQKNCIKAILEELNTNDKALVNLSCGAGKTIIFTSLVEQILERKPDFKCIILVNRNVLIQQTADKFNIPVGIYSAGEGKKELHHPITIASVQSLANCKDLPKVHCLIVDEVHSLRLDLGLGKRVYNKLIPTKVIGFTATPFYPDGRPIYGPGEFFDRPPCYSKTMREMTNNGYLAPLKLAGEDDKTNIDISNVKKHKNDYVILDLERVILNSKDKVKLQVKDIIRRTADRKKVAILCVTIKHAELVYKLLLEHEQIATIMHSKQNDDTQAEAKRRLIKGNAKFIVSVMMLTTGWDFPALDALAICRPTRSRVLFVQAVGRVARKAPGKMSGLVLDYGNIIPNLGHPYDITPLQNSKKKLSVKMCISCLEYTPTTSKQCSTCGTVFMTMCSVCFEMKPYGERCKCGNKRGIDPYKNLTSEVSKASKPYFVHKADLYEYTAKSGRKIPRVDYYIKCVGFTRVLVSEFIFHMDYKAAQRFFTPPKHIWIAKDSRGYNKIVRKSYE